MAALVEWGTKPAQRKRETLGPYLPAAALRWRGGWAGGRDFFFKTQPALERCPIQRISAADVGWEGGYGGGAALTRGRKVGPIQVRKFIFSAGRDGARRSASHDQKPFIDRLYRDSEL